YRTNGTDTRTILTATRAGGVATFTHAANNLLFRRGEKITITGVANPSFSGQYFVVGTPTATSFSVAQAGPDATSSGGTATTLNIGGCLTGGAFYNSNLFPAEYFNNFFFTDCNSGRVIRATLDNDTNAVTSVDYFSRPLTSSGIDTEQGPDGAFYVLYNGGQIYRYGYAQTAQRLIVSPQILPIDEGGAASFSVRLAVQPTENVVADAFFILGDTDTVSFGGPLVFTPDNWATPQ